MKHKLWSSLLLFALTLCPVALASNTWYVDGVNGSDNNNCKTPQTACKTIGHAISLASSRDSVMVASATYTENLTINISLKVIGAGASTTIIDGGGKRRVVTIPTSNAHVTLSGVTITDGRAVTGGGIFNGGTLTVIRSAVFENRAFNSCGKKTYCPAMGGGIYTTGTLTIDSSTVADNSAATICYLCGVASGGGIYNDGTMTISHSTISGNGAGGDGLGTGGGIGGGGAVSISNSTIAGNTANAHLCGGGGISAGGTMTISNSTISGNKTNCEGGGISGTATLQNSIVANNVANNEGGNCWGTMTSNGYNLSSDNTCNFDNTGDLNNTDAMLGTLGNNGGPTQTQALLSGSPAIDAGNPNGCTDGNGKLLKTDQRGYPRPDHEDTGGCDMGAFERQKD